MTLVTKITKLARIPELLKRKQKSDKKSEKKDKNSDKRPPFPLKDKPGYRKTTNFSQPKVKSIIPESKDKSPKSAKKNGIGTRIDLKV